MGTIVSLVMGVAAAALFWRSGVFAGFWSSLAATLVALWSAGIMHNYATQRAFSRHQRLRQLRHNQGATADELAELDSTPIHPTPEDIELVPDGITRINMLASLAVLALLVWALVQSFA